MYSTLVFVIYSHPTADKTDDDDDDDAAIKDDERTQAHNGHFNQQKRHRRSK